jgi:hypothetical protein
MDLQVPYKKWIYRFPTKNGFTGSLQNGGAPTRKRHFRY